MWADVPTSFQDRREHDRKTSEFIVHDRISDLLLGFHWFCIRNPSFFEDQTNEFSSSSTRYVVVKNFPVRHFFGNKKIMQHANFYHNIDSFFSPDEWPSSYVHLHKLYIYSLSPYFFGDLIFARILYV